MREFFVFCGVVLNVGALAVISTGGTFFDGVVLGWAGATSIVLGMYIDSVMR